MAMTLLEIVREFAGRTGIGRPSVAVASGDDSVVQLVGLCNEILTDITNRGESWPKLQKEATFLTTATEEQTTLVIANLYGFKYIIEGTLFDRTNRRQLFGPRSAQLWQQAKAINNIGPFYSYRVWQGKFFAQPTPPANLTWAFEYASDFAVQATGAGAYKKRFTVDSDVFLLNEDLMLMGLNWKWRMRKGLAYAQDKQDYEALITNEIGNDSTSGELNLNGGSGDIKPGIWVPSGSWHLP